MKCWVRACKENKNGECTKYTSEEELIWDFKTGGGCALSWFLTGKLPERKQDASEEAMADA